MFDARRRIRRGCAAERGDVSAAAARCRARPRAGPTPAPAPPAPRRSRCPRRRRRHARDPGHEGARQDPIHLTRSRRAHERGEELGAEAVSDEEAVKVLRKTSKMRRSR